MQIFVDADACPVVAIIENIAKENGVPVTLLCDTNHVLPSDYSEVVVVGAGADAVDYKLISICHKGDIVVSQDYGVAAMALGKGAYAIHQSGRWYTNNNIDQMLMERHLNKKARRSSHKNHIKGPKKRTEEDDVRFAQSFEKMLMMVQEKFQKKSLIHGNQICWLIIRIPDWIMKPIQKLNNCRLTPLVKKKLRHTPFHKRNDRSYVSD